MSLQTPEWCPRYWLVFFRCRSSFYPVCCVNQWTYTYQHANLYAYIDPNQIIAFGLPPVVDAETGEPMAPPEVILKDDSLNNFDDPALQRLLDMNPLTEAELDAMLAEFDIDQL